jgi:hypothetical protein
MAIGIYYNAYLCDQSYNKICPINYVFIQFSRVISAVPQAYLTVNIQDPVLNANNVSFVDEIYNLIISDHSGNEVFRGQIDQFTTPGKTTPLGVSDLESYGTMDHIALYASSILQNFADIMAIPDPTSTVYGRSFPDGTQIGSALTTLISEAIAQPNSPVATLSVGTIQTPNDSTGAPVVINSTQALYAASYLEWIHVLSSLATSDWYLSGVTPGAPGTVFNMVNLLSTDRSDSVILTLTQGATNNNLVGMTFSVDRRQMATKVIVVGAQDGVNQVVVSAENTVVEAAFGRKERIIPVRALDTPATAQVYANSYLTQVSQKLPLNSIQLYPVQDYAVLQTFSLGDVISLSVNWKLIQVSRRRMRVMGIVTTADNQGVERNYLSLKEPTS